MRRSDERKQWEHTDEEEALHGFDLTADDDMPPSLRAELNEYSDATTAAKTTAATLRADLDLAVGLLREYNDRILCEEAPSEADVGDIHCIDLTDPNGRPTCKNCRVRAFLTDYDTRTKGGEST